MLTSYMIATGSRSNSHRKSKRTQLNTTRRSHTISGSESRMLNYQTDTSNNNNNIIDLNMSEPVVDNTNIDTPAKSDQSTVPSQSPTCTSTTNNVRNASPPKYISIKFRDSRNDIRKVLIPFDTTLSNLQHEISQLMEFKSVRSFNKRYIISYRTDDVIHEIHNDAQLQDVLHTQTQSQSTHDTIPRRSPAIRLHLKQLPRRSSKSSNSSSPTTSPNTSTINDNATVDNIATVNRTQSDVLTTLEVSAINNELQGIETAPATSIQAVVAEQPVNYDPSQAETSISATNVVVQALIQNVIDHAVHNNDTIQSSAVSTCPTPISIHSPIIKPTAKQITESTELQCLTNDLNSILSVHSDLPTHVNQVDTAQLPVLYNDLTSVATHLKKQLSVVEQLVSSVAHLLPHQQHSTTTVDSNSVYNTCTPIPSLTSPTDKQRQSTSDINHAVLSLDSTQHPITHSSIATTNDNTPSSTPLTTAIQHSSSIDASTQDVLSSQSKSLNSAPLNDQRIDTPHTVTAVTLKQFGMAPVMHEHIDLTTDNMQQPNLIDTTISPDPCMPSPVLQSINSDDKTIVASSDIGRRYVDLLTHSNATIATTSTFESKLAILKELGYNNRTFNEVLLNSAKGDLESVIADLQQFYKK